MTKECEEIIRLSPVAWQHINLIGKYEFDSNAQPLNLQGLIEMLINNPEINLSSQSQS